MKKFEVVNLKPEIDLKVLWRLSGRDTLLNPPVAPSRCSGESMKDQTHDREAFYRFHSFCLDLSWFCVI